MRKEFLTVFPQDSDGWVFGVEMMGKIAVLQKEEGVRLDPDRVVALHARLGESGAQAVVQRARRELVARLDRLDRLAGDPRWVDRVDTAACARSIAGCARQIGLTSLARVAGDVAACAKAGDGPALAATLARLGRIGDRSLAAMCAVRGLSG